MILVRGELAWYELQLKRMGQGKEPKMDLKAINAWLYNIRLLLGKAFRKKN